MRYSLQREKVYEVLQKNPRHLRAEEVWEEAKKDLPDIGAATVYRNLNALVEMNLVRRIKSVDGVDHYDAYTQPHPHFICVRCANVYDTNLEYKDILSNIRKQSQDNILDVEIFIKGICKNCQKVHNNN